VGLRLNAIDGRLGLVTPDGKPYRGVLVTGTQVARCVYRPGKELTIACLSGHQEIRCLELGGAGKRAPKAVVKLGGKALGADAAVADGVITVVLDAPLRLEAGQTLAVALK
jgi:hypothetical protein